MIFFSGHLPTRRYPEAGQKICYDNLISYEDCDGIDLVSFVNLGESKFSVDCDYSFCRSVAFVRLNNFRRFFNALLNITLPLDVAVRCDKRALSLINELAIINGESRIHIEYQQSAFVLFFLPSSFDSTVVFHDVISQSIGRRFLNRSKYSVAYWFWRFQYYLAVRWEKRLASIVKKSIVLSKKDKLLLVERGFPTDSVFVNYPKVSEAFYQVKRDSIVPDVIVFWGAMNRKENEDAVIWFISSIFPIVIKHKPNAKFYIVGASPSDEIIRQKSNNVFVTGFVDDPLPYFEMATVFVAPLRFGAGVKIKVLEAIAANVPIVGTSVAAEGIECDGDLLHVVDNPNDFALAVSSLLK